MTDVSGRVIFCTLLLTACLASAVGIRGTEFIPTTDFYPYMLFHYNHQITITNDASGNARDAILVSGSASTNGSNIYLKGAVHYGTNGMTVNPTNMTMSLFVSNLASSVALTAQYYVYSTNIFPMGCYFRRIPSTTRFEAFGGRYDGNVSSRWSVTVDPVAQYTGWTHVVFVSGSDGAFLYFDGVLVGSDVVPSSGGAYVIADFTPDISRNATGSVGGVGGVDNIMLFNAALDSNAVIRLYRWLSLWQVTP